MAVAVAHLHLVKDMQQGELFYNLLVQFEYGYG